MTSDATAAIEDLYHAAWGRIVATLIRLLGDFDVAEDAAQDAFAAAVTRWAEEGVPANPRAWVIRTARNKGIDRLRRRSSLAAKLAAGALPAPQAAGPGIGFEEIPDDELRLIFTCCHPALNMDAQVALTLRTLCGLGTDEIARAFLVSPPTMAQRLTRAKQKIRVAGIPYAVPTAAEMPERLDAVLAVIYLVFNEGYASTSGTQFVRFDLCTGAIRLARLLLSLLGGAAPPEVSGLLALMLLHDARRRARTDARGELVLLEQQDRSLWDRGQIDAALPLVEEALRGGGGSYALQAAIAALHCEAESAAQTDWPQILRLYDVLSLRYPSPVVTLNRVVAVSMVHGPAAALAEIDRIDGLRDFHLLHATRADLLRRLGAGTAAAAEYARALAAATNETERRFLARRLAEVNGPSAPP